MSNYHVGLGFAGIYAGTMKNDYEWRNKSDVTKEALCAVAQYLHEKRKEFRFTLEDVSYRLAVTEIKGEPDEEQNSCCD